MRILHVVGSFGVGGAEQLTAHLLDGFQQLGHEVTAVSLFDAQGSHLEEFLRRREIPVVHLRKRLGFDARVVERLHRVFQRFRPDIVHTHGYVLAYTLGVAAAAGVRGQVHTIHNVAGRDMPWWGRYVLSLAGLMGVVPVAVSSEVARTARSRYRIEAATISNGVPVASYRLTRKNRESWRRQNGFSEDALLVTSVARLAAQKNHSLLLRAVVRLAPTQAVQVLLVGDGPLKGRLQDEAETLGIQERVRFLGIRSDIPDILAASDLFVLSSDAEGNPLAVMEAMAAGLPVVATAVGGVPELLTDGKEGFVVAPGDEAALAAALSRLIDCPEQRRAMGRDAERKAAAVFDVARTVQSYTALYEKLAARPSG